MKLKNVPKLVAIAYNYNADLYLEDEYNHIKYVYCDQEGKEINKELLKPYNIELKNDDNYSDFEYMPFYKGKNIFKEYNNIDIEKVGKEVK